MGYYVETMDVDFTIPHEYLDDAFKAMCDLNWRNDLKSGGRWPAVENADDSAPREDKWFSWMAWDYHVTCKSAEDIFRDLGFETHMDDGDFHLSFYNSKIGDEEHFLRAVAPFVRHGSFIEWRGEDGSMWRYAFAFGKMLVQNATIVWK